jgi:hypothetical protein
VTASPVRIERPVVTLSLIENSSDDESERLTISRSRQSSSIASESHLPTLPSLEDSHHSVEDLKPSLEATLIDARLETATVSSEYIQDSLEGIEPIVAAQQPAQSSSQQVSPMLPNALPALHKAEAVAEPLKEKLSAVITEAAAQVLVDPSPNKWRDWLQSTTEQLAKNVQDRGSRALDAISAVTLSGASVRKRKRNPEGVASVGEEQKQLSGIGTLHVELVSAYKVCLSSPTALTSLAYVS